jgi:hypothetical protein
MITINKKIFILLITTIIVHFYVPTPYSEFNFTKKKNLNKLYIATFTAFLIVFTDVILNIDQFSKDALTTWILMLILGITILYYIISKQLFISEEQYFLTMKENNEIDLNIIEAIIKNLDLDEKGRIYTEKIKNNRIIEKKQLDDYFNKLNKDNSK